MFNIYLAKWLFKYSQYMAIILALIKAIVDGGLNSGIKYWKESDNNSIWSKLEGKMSKLTWLVYVYVYTYPLCWITLIEILISDKGDMTSSETYLYLYYVVFTTIFVAKFKIMWCQNMSRQILLMFVYTIRTTPRGAVGIPWRTMSFL